MTGTKEEVLSTFEAHFKCREIAERWGMSENTVFNLFVDEPGVVKIGNRNPKRRTRVSLFIPASVAQRVYDRIRTPGSGCT